MYVGCVPAGPVSASAFDRMVADSMKDLDDEDVSDTEDPDLLVGLSKPCCPNCVRILWESSA